MKWIRRVLLKIQNGHDSVHRRTDGQGETSIPPFNLVEAEGIITYLSYLIRVKCHWCLFLRVLPLYVGWSTSWSLTPLISRFMGPIWGPSGADRTHVCPMNIVIRDIEAETKLSPFRRRIFKCIFVNENMWILLRMSLKFVPKVPINNTPTLI